MTLSELVAQDYGDNISHFTRALAAHLGAEGARLRPSTTRKWFLDPRHRHFRYPSQRLARAIVSLSGERVSFDEIYNPPCAPREAA